MNIEGSNLQTHDISSEEFREVVFLDIDKTYRIEAPVSLSFRQGGTTHRVIDSEGVVHCYPAPETGLTALRWKARPGFSSVSF